MIALVLCFILGVANFALHAAVLQSGHEFVEDTKLYFGRYFGKSASYLIEFAVLLAALAFTHAGSSLAVIFYGVYSALNMLAAWLLRSGRP